MSNNQVSTKTVVGGGLAGCVVVAALVMGSDRVVSFIRGWEDGPNPNIVYADKLAAGLPTACGGLTRHITTTPIVVGARWSDEKCNREIAKAVEKVQTGLLRCFVLTPPQSVFDGATSHAWNVGTSLTCSSGAMKAWNAGEWQLGCKRLYVSDGGKPVWSYVKTGRKLANGKPEYKFVKGLANRRAAEYEFCMEDVK